jgi:MFS family permease
MKRFLRKLGICIAAFLLSIILTILVPFYSNIAQSQGLPEWLIGIFFSWCPFIGALCSALIPPYIERFGNSSILIFGLLCAASSSLIMAMLPNSSFIEAVIKSFLARTLAGIGFGLSIVSMYSIITTEYQKDLSTMFAMVETSNGLGFIFGPIVGSAIFQFGGFSLACIFAGLIMFGYIPILCYIIGPTVPNSVHESNINIWRIARKPVIFI